MGKTKSLELPSAPTYQTDPIYKQGSQSLLDYGTQLSKGDFTGNLSWLSPTINNNNSASALSYAQGILQPQFRDTLQQITNSAAANGQLNSSTFTDALARSQSDLNSQYQSIVSQQAINDSNQSNANRLSLFGTGLNSLNQATTFGQNNQNSLNEFNLKNYDNLVANSIQNYNNDLANQKGGFMGGLKGGLGGLGLGMALAPFTGGASLLATGLLAGGGAALGSQSTQQSNAGGQLLGLGSLLGFGGSGGGLSSALQGLLSGASSNTDKGYTHN